MTKWAIYMQYEQWVPVNWAPMFDTEKEANDWIAEVNDWDGRVEAFEIEMEEVF